MGGFFGVASKEDCVFDLFFGTDYHSHLGTRRAGMAVYSRDYGFDRAIHNIENAPFRTKFDREANEMKGNIGIGSISDYEPQPLIVRSHHGTYSIATVGKINNTDDILSKLLFSSHMHFLEMSGGTINATELVATIINQKENLIEGIQYAQEIIDGSMTILLMTPKGIYAARDRLGRTPVAIGKKDNAYCVSFESFAYLNLGYTNVRELGPGKYIGRDGKVDFINQTGNIKFDINLEYRTYLFWKLHGAVFVDAGNVWTTRDYSDQQGGKFTFDNFYKQIAVAYGLGLRLNLDYFVLRFDGGMKAVNPVYSDSRRHFPIIHPNFSREFTFHFAVGLPF